MLHTLFKCMRSRREWIFRFFWEIDCVCAMCLYVHVYSRCHSFIHSFHLSLGDEIWAQNSSIQTLNQIFYFLIIFSFGCSALPQSEISQNERYVDGTNSASARRFKYFDLSRVIKSATEWRTRRMGAEYIALVASLRFGTCKRAYLKVCCENLLYYIIYDLMKIPSGQMYRNVSSHPHHNDTSILIFSHIRTRIDIYPPWAYSFQL